MGEALTARQVLQFYIDAGVDEAIGDAPVDRYAQAAKAKAAKPIAAPATAPLASPPPVPGALPAMPRPSGDAAVKGAYALAKAATSVDELRKALDTFDGCALKRTATNLVLGDGNPDANVVLIGEAPGAEEDRQGLPFVGPSGKLLDRMLAAIGLDRSTVFISNTVFWRPPGNRTPTTQETAVCMPFVERLLEIIDPAVLVALGGPAAKALLAQTVGIGKLRGHWYTFSTPNLSRPIQATALFHPAYLLRSPARKRDAWRDLLEIRRKLDSLS